MLEIFSKCRIIQSEADSKTCYLHLCYSIILFLNEYTVEHNTFSQFHDFKRKGCTCWREVRMMAKSYFGPQNASNALSFSPTLAPWRSKPVRTVSAGHFWRAKQSTRAVGARSHQIRDLPDANQKLAKKHDRPDPIQALRPENVGQSEILREVRLFGLFVHFANTS